MSGRITRFLREYVLGFSIIVIICGLFLLCMGLMFFFFKNVIHPSSSPLHFIENPVGEWNWYTLAAGLIIFGIGGYYLYSYLKKRKFVLDELKTDKRSEILKKRNKLETTVKHLPTKFQRMLTEKEDEFNIK